MHEKTHPWLAWARRIQAIAQTGLNLTEGYYDKQNYEKLLGIAAEIIESHSRLECADVAATLRVQPGYATVKVDVRGAVVREGKVLLAREKMDGKWTLPGGWADVGDLPSEMVAREVLEESRVVCEPYRVVGVYDANRAGRPMEFFHAYKIVFLCRYLSGEPGGSEETHEARFFGFEELPELSWPRTDPRHLEDVRAALENPARQPSFD
jgi:ADP-ribose pyrophosphatase YjhB (NUDIX family)